MSKANQKFSKKDPSLKEITDKNYNKTIQIKDEFSVRENNFKRRII